MGFSFSPLALPAPRHSAQEKDAGAPQMTGRTSSNTSLTAMPSKRGQPVPSAVRDEAPPSLAREPPRALGPVINANDSTLTHAMYAWLEGCVTKLHTTPISPLPAPPCGEGWGGGSDPRQRIKQDLDVRPGVCGNPLPGPPPSRCRPYGPQGEGKKNCLVFGQSVVPLADSELAPLTPALSPCRGRGGNEARESGMMRASGRATEAGPWIPAFAGMTEK